ncbi:MAG: pyridoxamine 5'-phosphate oxidase family protein [Bauldia sp.]
MTDTRAAFSPVRAAREVLAAADTGGLATLDGEGRPYASFVAVGTMPAGDPVLLISSLALHTQNLKRRPDASLILVAPGGETGNPLAGARLSVSGTFRPTDDGDARRRYLARHPEAEDFAAFADFSFYRMEARQSHLVAGFGRIVDIAPADLFPDFVGCEAMIAAEAEIVEHMNADHRATMNLYAEKLLEAGAGDWVARAADPDGLDLARGPDRARLWFPERCSTPDAVRRALKSLAQAARAA